MSLNHAASHDDLRTRLALALGYHDYPSNATAEPYLTYIYKRHVGSGALDEWLELFINVVDHFDDNAKGPRAVGSIQTLIDELAASGFQNLFTDTSAGHAARIEHVEDSVMYILGTWTTMLSSFVQRRNQSRKVVTAYRTYSNVAVSVPEPLENDIAGLIAGCELLPGGRWDHRFEFGQDAATKLIMLLFGQANTPASPTHLSLQSVYPKAFGMQSSQTTCPLYEDIDAQESLSIKATRLNAFTLNVLSAVQVSWTQNVSRHMLLTKPGGHHTLELFSLPCAFAVTTSECVGVPSELAQEIQESYAMLFNAWHEFPLHIRLGHWMSLRKFCWCWSCSAHRYRRQCIGKCKQGITASSRRGKTGKKIVPSEFDPMLVELTETPAEFDWTPGDFPHLWTRITRLEQHLQTSRPWSLWILFRDRRDTMQFWTFLFATVVVLLTILQVLLGIAQVVGSFR